MIARENTNSSEKGHMNARRVDDDSETDHWKIDKRIPLALILALGFQFFGGFWWLAVLGARVTALEAQAPLREDVIEMKVKILNVERIILRWEAREDMARGADKE